MLQTIKSIARIGLTAKGFIYCLIGTLAFMSAFEIGGKTNESTGKSSIFNTLQHLPAGKPILILLTAGLLCYTFWRAVQFFKDTENKGSDVKGWGKRARYLFSCIAYLSFAVVAIKTLVNGNQNKGGSGNQEMVSTLMNKPFGQQLVFITAGIIASIGIYQIFYGLSKKYKKHVDTLNLQSSAAKYLLTSGIVGYVSRGVVWLVIAWLMFKAALHANAREAGDTSTAFNFLENSYGSYLLAALASGLILYGVFNFVRARYESFNL
jgi:hypothetical protein